jgi:hypothetical protein
MKIARINKKEPPKGKLELAVDEGLSSNRGRVQDLLRSDRRKLTLVIL